MIENPFDTPIPGQSLTDVPGNGPWEHPPQFTNIDDASAPQAGPPMAPSPFSTTTESPYEGGGDQGPF